MHPNREGSLSAVTLVLHKVGRYRASKMGAYWKAERSEPDKFIQSFVGEAS